MFNILVKAFNPTRAQTWLEMFLGYLIVGWVAALIGLIVLMIMD